MSSAGNSRSLFQDIGSRKFVHSVLVILDTDHISIPKPNEVEHKVRFLLSENGDRGSRIRMMIRDIVFWAETRSDEPVYVLVISKDKNLEEDAKFSTVRELLEKHRDFHLTVVKPDTVLSL
ncbi:hypothetical protein F2Q68_00045448 [Brassica cretica]|uniref:Uncharacterized protein n=1 Tax=Brassica cretica TaxID=69181 RepID=A0A8S9LLR3_BRACR|nr:hypothetical protein F2Q68_00045448 [Brassica cretica]